MADVFISYARTDRETAGKLARALEDQGYSVWWDPVIPPGQKWAEVVGRQLGAARCVVVLWSAVSVKKRWVRKEASFADERNKLIPAKLEDVTIPFEFADVQAADFSFWDGGKNHEGFQHLVAAISQQLRKLPSEQQPEEDIVINTKQAEEQLTDDRETNYQTSSNDVNIAKNFVEPHEKHQEQPEPIPKRRKLLSKNIIIIHGTRLFHDDRGLGAWIGGCPVARK